MAHRLRWRDGAGAEANDLAGRSGGLTFEMFPAHATLRRTFVRRLEILGEAAKKVPGEFRAAHPLFEWRSMAGMRELLNHDEFGVDFVLVWDVVRNRVPELRGRHARHLTSGRSGCAPQPLCHSHSPDK